MRKLLTRATVTGLMFGLAACGQQGPGNDQAAANAANEAPSNQMAMNDPDNPYGQAEMQMHDRMMAAQGANASDMWIRKMIEHHRGAIEMSNILIQQGGDPRVLEKARITAQKQQTEIAELERMLAGGETATQASATASQSAAKVEPRKAAPAPKAKAETPPAAPRTEPKAAPNAPAATPSCAPEHRALGHC